MLLKMYKIFVGFNFYKFEKQHQVALKIMLSISNTAGSERLNQQTTAAAPPPTSAATKTAATRVHHIGGKHLFWVVLQVGE